jgi:hypothetical protein
MVEKLGRFRVEINKSLKTLKRMRAGSLDKKRALEMAGTSP